MKETQD